MTSPWYRSRLFWFGLPGLLFLGWMWAGYQARLVHMGWIGGGGNYSLGWGGGQVTGSFTSRRDMSPMTEDGFFLSEIPIDPADGQSFFPPAIFTTEGWAGIALANWFLMAVYLALWLGGLVLWQRRKQRLAVVRSHGG